MNKKILFQQGFIIAAISILAVSCQAQPPTPTQPENTYEVQNIQVQTANPQKTAGVTEDFPLPNCGGTGKLTQTLGTQVSVSKSVELGGTAKLTLGGEYTLPSAVKAQVQFAIEATYKQQYDTANSRLDTIVMEAAPGSHVIYTIEWERQEFSSVVTFEYDREFLQTPYTFIMNVPKISGSRGENCPNNSPTAPVLPTNTPETPSIAGNWEGTTSGTNPEGNPLTEVTTTASIPNNCQIGDKCGTFSTEYCTYEMTLTGVQDKIFVFQTSSISGESFCFGSGNYAKAEITFISDSKIYFHYQTDNNLIREGTFTKK